MKESEKIVGKLVMCCHDHNWIDTSYGSRADDISTNTYVCGT